MAIMRCPTCSGEIDIADLNMQHGVGLCRSCGGLRSLEDIATMPGLSVAEIDTPPPGCRVREATGCIEFIASTRSLGTAISLAFVAIFWNGIVSLFLVLALSGIYSHLIRPTPAGPPPSNGITATLSGTVFLCLFLVPFVLVGIYCLTSCVMAIFGAVSVEIDGERGRVRTGIGPIAWSRRFDAGNVRSVRLGETSYQMNGAPLPLIIIETNRKVKFGTGLSDVRRQWLASALANRLLAAAASFE